MTPTDSLAYGRHGFKEPQERRPPRRYQGKHRFDARRADQLSVHYLQPDHVTASPWAPNR